MKDTLVIQVSLVNPKIGWTLTLYSDEYHSDDIEEMSNYEIQNLINRVRNIPSSLIEKDENHIGTSLLENILLKRRVKEMENKIEKMPFKRDSEYLDATE